MKWTTWVCSALLTLGTLASLSGQEFPEIPNNPVVAHRGAAEFAPENTLSSISEAIAVGAQGAEFDIYQTSDGVIYLMHDGNFKRTCGLDAPAGSLTFQQMRELEAGSWKDPKFANEKVPTLDEALCLLKWTGTRPVIEVKASGFEEKVVETVRRLGFVPGATIIDFSTERVKKFRELAPEIPVAWLCGFDEKVPEEEIAETIITTLRGCGTNLVDMHFGRATPTLIERLKGEGIHVWVWTVDRPEDMARLIDAGVESITTNRPIFALEAWNAKK